MTRERKLAIQMWEDIRAHIRDVPRIKDVNVLFVEELKHQFCIEHELHWAHGCWFCTYVRYLDDIHGEGCQRCPLSDGSSGAISGDTTGCGHNAFNRVLGAKQRKAKLKACDEIIRILNGRLK